LQAGKIAGGHLLPAKDFSLSVVSEEPWKIKRKNGVEGGYGHFSEELIRFH
jgi:hypothetical protein